MDMIVVALGGNALLRRGERPELELQRRKPACRFAESGGEAVIGSLDQLPALLEARSGTTVSRRFSGLEWWP